VTHEVVAMNIPPNKEILLGQFIKQIAHLHVLQLATLSDAVGVDLDEDQHEDNQQAQGSVDDECSNEKTIVGEEGIVSALVVASVDGLYDRQQGRSSQNADRHLKDAP
jgi:hypothetical protein